MKFTIIDTDAGKRLDIFVTENVPQLSRSFVQKQCEAGIVLVNSEPRNSSYKLKEDDKVDVQIDMDNLMHVPEISLPIVYEDDDCIVINKPVGVLTHSKGVFNPEASVASFITPKLAFPDPADDENARAGIVHRLDRATSGVLICAKTPAAMSWLQKQFSSRRVKKTYKAVVTGKMENKHAIIDMPIARNPKNLKQFMAHPNGKPSVTEYEVEQSNDKYSLLILKPTTGRTHQLRVHLAQLEHPIVGDPLYGGEAHPRMLLHAQQLEITLPNRQRHIFMAALPDEFTDIMK